jgi:hypothetical protein
MNGWREFDNVVGIKTAAVVFLIANIGARACPALRRSPASTPSSLML